MKSAPAFFRRNASPELRSAFLALPDEHKKHLMEVTGRRLPEVWAFVVKQAGLAQGGFRMDKLPQRYSMFGPRLAQALVKPNNQGDVLVVITLEFLRLERPAWLPEVQTAIRDGGEAAPLDLANAELAKMEADHGKDPLWELFCAFCRFGAEDVFFEVDFGGSSKEMGAAVEARAEGVESDPDADPCSDIQRLSAQARGLLDAASNVKRFDLATVNEIYRKLHERGEQLRTAVEQLAVETGQPVRDWTNLEDLKHLLQELEALKLHRGAKQVAQARLESVRSLLSKVSGLRIGLKAWREELLNHCNQAVQQLGAAAGKDAPPNLPGTGEGEAWLKAAYALKDDALDELLKELERIALGELAFFIGHTSWEHLDFAVATTTEPQRAAVLTESPAPAPIQPMPLSTPTASPSEKASPASTESPLKAAAKTQPPSAEIAVAPGSTGAEPTKQADEVTGAEAGAEASAVTQPNAPKSPTDQVSTSDPRVEKVVPPTTETRPVPEPPQEPRTSTPGGAPTSASINTALPQNSHFEVLAKLEAGGLQCLMADYVEAMPPEDAAHLPSPLVFKVLRLQAGLRSPEDELAEQTRLHLKELAELPIPDSVAGRLLLWSAAIVPVFVDSGCVAPVILQNAMDNSLPASLRDFSRNTLGLLREIVNCHPSFIHEGESREVWENELAKLQSQVRAFFENAQTQTLNYQLASVVWHRLTGKGGQLRLLGDQLLTQAGRFMEARVTELQVDLEDSSRFRRLIERVTRELTSGKVEPIIAGAYTQLTKKAGNLSRLATRVLEHHRRQPQEANFVADRIRRFRQTTVPILERFTTEKSAEDIGPLEAVAVGAARRAASQVLKLFRDRQGWTEPVKDPNEELTITQLRVADLRLDTKTRRPLGNRQSVLLALTHAAHSGLMTPAAAIDARSSSGDVAGARCLLEAARSQLPRDEVDHVQMSVEERARDWRTQTEQSLKTARITVMNARMLGVVPEAEAATKEAQLVAQEKRICETEDYSAVIEEVRGVVQELDNRTREEAGKLRAQIQECRIPDKAAEERLLSLVAKGDLATAREYLNRLQAGQPLPAAREVALVGGFDLLRQNEILSGFRAANNLEGLLQAVRTGGRFAHRSFGEHSQVERQQAVAWLNAWQRVRPATVPNEADVTAVLTGLGFSIEKCQVSHQVGRAISEVRAVPITDRNICAIPQLGSASGGHIRILHLAGDAPELVVESAQKIHGVGFQCVFYGGCFEPDSRVKLARLCREKQLTLLVLDDLLVAHLAHVRGLRLSAFFLASVPYTWADPFVSTSSLVSPEMFFGRSVALASLLDMHQQRCFVYGGRQLGKTALLREVERRFHRPEQQQFALWFDLLANGFGVEAEPPLIWELLEPRFRILPGFKDSWLACEKRSRRLEDSIVHWLNADDRRRFLLLLDEGDRFLDRDALRDFSESRRLKGLMDETNRRFKVIFSGLHNVQRTTTQSNHPLAHLGEPINIGAFSENGEWMEAYSLLTVPLTALGYEFESPDLPSRILTLCNFYPGLLQQFGSRLLQRSRNQAPAPPPRRISDHDVDAVARDEEFRKFMVDRFKWTLQLDPRYHYLAYTYAFLFHSDPRTAARGYTANELRKQVEGNRPAEFSHLGKEDFLSLLDEMRGLGIFRKDSKDRYSLRNANVLLLLGDTDTILDELVSNRALPKAEYRAESFHGPIAAKPASMRRRVLTRSNEAKLAGRHGVVVITGSPMLELGLTEESLRGAFPQYDLTRVSGVCVADLVPCMERARESKLEGTHILVVNDQLPWDATWVEDALTRCARLKSQTRFVSVVFLAPSELFWKAGALDNLPEGVVRLPICKWGQEFVEPWLAAANHPIPEDGAQRLLSKTGGWPKLLHLFARQLETIGNYSDALAEVDRQINLTLVGPNAAQEFMGSGPAATEAFKLLRAFRASSPDTMQSFFSADIDEAADLVGVPAAELRELVSKAENLQLIARKAPNCYEWDPLFDRLLLNR